MPEESIFSKLKKKDAAPEPGQLKAAPPPPPRPEQTAPPPPPPAAAAVQAPRPEQAAPPPPPPLPVPDGRFAAMEAALGALRAELEVLKNRPEPEPVPPPPGGGEEFAFRLGRTEDLLAELRRRVAADEEALRAETGKAASRDELKNMELQVADLSGSFDGLKKTFSSEGELAARLGQMEAGLAGLRTAFEGQQRKFRTELESLAPREEADAVRVNLAAAMASIDEIKLNFAQYSDELSSVASECRKALGEAQGLSRAAAQGGVAGKFDEHMKELVAKLNTRLSELETAMHAGLAELSARFSSNEVLYGKMFAAAEERLTKSLEPRLKDMDGQLRWLRENLIRLSDDYTVVAERKMRALEAKYSAFEAISRRMDAIDAALKKAGRIGLP